MSFFTIFIIFLISSCGTSSLNTKKSINKVNKTKETKHNKFDSKLSHLENKIYMLTEKVNSLERTIIYIKNKNNNKKNYIPVEKKEKYSPFKKQITQIPSSNIGYYKEAMQNYQKKNYYIAQKLFVQFLKERENLLTDDAKYWLTKIDMKQNNKKLAKEKLEDLIIEYPDTNKAPKILYSLIKLEKDDKTKQGLINKLLSDYANTPEAKKIKQNMRTNALYK